MIPVPAALRVVRIDLRVGGLRIDDDYVVRLRPSVVTAILDKQRAYVTDVLQASMEHNVQFAYCKSNQH